MKWLAFLTVAAVISGAGVAHAQDVSSDDASNSSTTKLPKTKKTREDIDEEITNARLRATTGAKSLLSLQTLFNYNGSSIDHPLAKDRPQLSPGTVENDPAKLTGSISAKYRATDHDNINLGVGVGWLTPSYDGQRGQVEDPYLAYGRVFKAGNVQNALNVAGSLYTADSSRKKNLLWESDIDHTMILPVGTSGKLQLGLNVGWYREFYSQTTSGQQDTLAAYPFLEYEFNPTVSFRTVYRGFTYFNTNDNTSTFQHDDPTQSMGFGISVARDFYLYPNVQWVWGDIRAEKTNVALQASINL